jgi:CRISPR type IV-associated protein Csf1
MSTDYVYPTHLIYDALNLKTLGVTEPCNSVCAFCGTKITHGIKLKDTISDAFTNFDILINRDASHVCTCCYSCLKEPKLRHMNFIAIGDSPETNAQLIYFKRNEIEKWLFNPPSPPFVFAVTISMKKHMSFKARINYSNKVFYIQKEDEQIPFSPDKYKPIFEAMNRLYKTFSKSTIQTGSYQQPYIQKYGFHEFKQDEAIIKDKRGTQQFNLLIYSLNMNEEQLNKFRKKTETNKQIKE